MKRRRSIAFTTAGIVSLSLCIFGSTKDPQDFDISNSTLRAQAREKVDYSSGDIVVKASVTPPQPKNKNGRLVCTKDRYIQSEQQVGLASWYGNQFHGELTASGERFDEHGNTIAHLTLPMGTEVLVENPETGVAVYAKVNDCGPYVKDRIADLSYGLAKKLGLVDKGVGKVVITVL
jgi:rare lipoprotein A (peptidoglycan hydrolase)